jgi:conjugative transfer signal peptidase TraF
VKLRITPDWLTLTLLGIGAMAWCYVVSTPYRLIYNPSESAPRGWYLQIPLRSLEINTWVLARMPTAAAELAEQRGYLPSSVPILKQIAARTGQHVCVRHGAVYVGQRVLARLRTEDGARRPLVAWNECRSLEVGEFLLINADSEVSFDSRYFGPVTNTDLIANVIPLWTW